MLSASICCCFNVMGAQGAIWLPVFGSVDLGVGVVRGSHGSCAGFLQRQR